MVALAYLSPFNFYILRKNGYSIIHSTGAKHTGHSDHALGYTEEFKSEENNIFLIEEDKG